jgi:TatD DNase family protein
VLTDTHCHLDFADFDADRSEVLDRSVQMGVDRILVPGVDLASSQKSLELAKSEKMIYSAVGIHPNDALKWDRNSLDELRFLAAHPKVVAVGEIGLDYFRDRAPRELQRMVFREQLKLAKEQNLPVVIHNRQAGLDLLSILREWHSDLKDSGSILADRPGVLHSFSEDVKFANEAIKSNYFVGFSGPVTFQNSQVLQDVVASISLEKILIETDAPFLTPHPYRGKRNEPSYVRLVADKIAELQNTTLTIVAQETTANAKQLFLW